MDVEVSRETAWKTLHATNHHVHETIDGGSYPISWQVEVLMNAWEAFVGSEGTTWTEGAREVDDGGGIPNVRMAELEGVKRVSVDDALVERVGEAAAEERPDAPVEGQSFDENLQIVLDAWNEYYGKKGVGWQARSTGDAG